MGCEIIHCHINAMCSELVLCQCISVSKGGKCQIFLTLITFKLFDIPKYIGITVFFRL